MARILTPYGLFRAYARGRAAARRAVAGGAPGMEFDRFGRAVGRKLLTRGRRTGLEYLLAPVATVRYWEYPFTLSCMPANGGRFLDVSSPRLFSLYVAKHNPAADVLMINPDADDAARSTLFGRTLGLGNFRVRGEDVSKLDAMRGQFDCVWSISVVEHIEGAYDDRAAVRYMYDALRPGGRMVLTVPVDRAFENEFRERDYYGTQPGSGGKYFFQRVYDEAAVHSRLLEPIGGKADVIRWFGEKVPGTFRDHERRWTTGGYEVSVTDPAEIAEKYREYDTWGEMPGFGVCGIMVQKPADAAQQV